VRFAIKPRGRQSADAAADNYQVEILLDRETRDVKRSALAAG